MRTRIANTVRISVVVTRSQLATSITFYIDAMTCGRIWLLLIAYATKKNTERQWTAKSSECT
tara:strand:- start:184 stop:369 length:186 start_codon:yes stop_codon:yes gene_type:complete